LSRWERQKKIDRIIMIALAVFVAGVLATVGFGYYNEKVKPLQQTVITVNGQSFDMEYYVERLDALTEGADRSRVNAVAGAVASQIIDNELVRQGARSFGVAVSQEEIDQAVQENELPDTEAYREMLAAELLARKLQEHFESQVPTSMEQSHFRSLIVETQQAASEAVSRLQAGENFTAVVADLSVNPNVETDPGWLPQEMITNSVVEDAAFETEPGETVFFYQDSATKKVGYWIIEVMDRDEEQGINVRAMLLGSRERVESVAANVTDDNFALLAEQFSQHASAEDGGDLGWVTGSDTISQTFNEVAFELEPDVISGPVRDEGVWTEGAYWVIQVMERGDHELSDTVRERLGAKWFNEWFTELKQSSDIQNNLDTEKTSIAVDMVMKRR
jgi:peptidyl-prolyl cis-trans isomerase SurA